MKRRTFLQASTAGAALAGTSAMATAAASVSTSPEYYEVRSYRLDSRGKQRLVSDYLRDAALPAWKRIGIGPVGVFTELGDEADPSIHVLLTYSTIEQFASARSDLENDSQYQTIGKDYLGAVVDDPAFVRLESSLMVAFAGFPKLELPGSEPRVLELRTYESYSEAKARRKVDMFNDGEIPIFGGVGLQPVFFGETLIGPRVPNLKYMLATSDLESNKAGWGKFVVDPAWERMKVMPKYADTVSKVSNIYLAPTDYSQV
ncbi:MAG: NIPSNAP family protein [Planctomycetales bacterium]|nr:NIPSNAP family protein [Planctomycetales bacterium]